MTEFALVFNFVVLDDPETLSDALNFRYDLFLHQVEAHRKKSDAKEQVERAECNGFLGILLFTLEFKERKFSKLTVACRNSSTCLSWHEISETWKQQEVFFFQLRKLLAKLFQFVWRSQMHHSRR